MLELLLLLRFIYEYMMIMCVSLFPSITPSPFHSKLTLSVNLFHHRSLITMDTPDTAPRLMGPFSVSLLLIDFSSWFGEVD